jgi:hypothetical protein
MFVESLPAGFDWEFFLYGKKRVAAWLVCVLELANRLLGAQVAETVIRRGGARLPRWVEAAVLDAWGDTLPGDSHSRDDVPMAERLRRPGGLLTALSRRWPNPIEAAVKLQVGPGTRRPLPLLQVGFLLRRTGRFLARAPSRKGDERLPGELPFQLHQAG